MIWSRFHHAHLDTSGALFGILHQLALAVSRVIGITASSLFLMCLMTVSFSGVFGPCILSASRLLSRCRTRYVNLSRSYNRHPFVIVCCIPGRLIPKLIGSSFTLLTLSIAAYPCDPTTQKRSTLGFILNPIMNGMMILFAEFVDRLISLHISWPPLPKTASRCSCSTDFFSTSFQAAVSLTDFKSCTVAVYR